MPKRPQTIHGTTPVMPEGEPVERGLFKDSGPVSQAAPTETSRFGRMFPDVPISRPTRKTLIKLGREMERPGQGADHPTLPGGFTYLGQFVDHDITLDETSKLTDPAATPGAIENMRTPKLDLDNLYLGGPGHAKAGMYEEDNLHLVVGRTVTSDDDTVTDKEYPNDLPREAPPSKKAIIGDGRNDENLAVAQTHLAFIKFHNKVVDTLGLEFEAAREVVTLHYQSIVLHDFVPRVVKRETYDDVLANGRQFFWTDTSQPLFMPVEFAGAAYRLGHSMVRDRYSWNRVFPDTDFGLLFAFSGGSGDFFGDDRLPSNWIIDWTRFHDFSNISGVENHASFNVAHLLDTRLAGVLKRLPEHSEQPVDFQSLAIRNLLRGRLIGLPTGQNVARGMGIEPLTAQEVAPDDHHHVDVLRELGFDEETPLWYYILREAELNHGGNHLGEVGSRIVVETFHGLIEGSKYSLKKDWKPEPQLQKSGLWHYTMADLLAFVDDLNPLGDSAP